MFGITAAHLVAFGAMMFAAASAFTLFGFVNHLDPTDTARPAPSASERAA